MLLLRILERMGLAVASASGLGLILAAVLIYRGQSAGPLLMMLLALAGLAGVIWGLSNRPSLIAAAEEADRQLDLADLLSTALSLGGAPFDEPFAVTVHALAAQRAAELSPSVLVLRKLTGRAWSGIGLTTALALAAMLISSNPGLIQAQAESDSPFVALSRVHEPRSESAGRAAWPQMIRPPRTREGFEEVDPLRMGEAEAESSKTAQATRAGSSRGQSTVPDGEGLGQASAPSAAAPSATIDLGPTDASASNPGGRISDGTGRTMPDAGMGSAAGLTVRAGVAPGRPTPPWRSDTWDAVRAQAMREVEDSSIPDAYRDLIRDYFSRN